jgi:hypothetical protein
MLRCVLLEVVSKPQIRFKGKAQADRESRCSQHTWVCEHLSEACAAPYSIKSDANPACGATQPLGLRWVLKPLLLSRRT